jgi:hypothetical protein
LSEVKEGYSSSYLEVVEKSVRRELSIFHIYSYFLVEDSYYKALFWSPIASEMNIQNAINEFNPKLTYKLNMKANHGNYKPPTNIITNDMSEVF